MIFNPVVMGGSEIKIAGASGTSGIGSHTLFESTESLSLDIGFEPKLVLIGYSLPDTDAIRTLFFLHDGKGFSKSDAYIVAEVEGGTLKISHGQLSSSIEFGWLALG